ncbi:MAG: long-chain-fatty-acid--CoA ligase [Caulobacterales bacterium]
MTASRIATLIEDAARAAPDRRAIITGQVTLTYSALHDRVLRCVGLLRHLGVRPDARIGYLGLNSIDFVILMQAAQRVGAVLVAINWRLAPPEIAYILKDSGIDLLISENARLEAVRTARGAVAISKVILTDAPFEGCAAFLDEVLAQQPDAELADIKSDMAALQLYTSGTTGNPKGALLTHGNLAASLAQCDKIQEDWARWDETDIALVAMPQFHIGGVAWTLQALKGKASMALLSTPDIDAIIDSLSNHGITKMFAVPAVLNMLLSHPKAADTTFPSMRELLYGASPISLPVLKRSMEKFPNAQFVQLYGATETCGTVVYLPPEDHAIQGTPRMAGCGKPYPDVALKITDSSGMELPPGAVGEVRLKSPLVMLGYHNLPQATEQALVDDWYRTGDAGYVDADGYLYLLDRVKDMIVSGAENIYPAEVENALAAHPAIADCGVIGVPDEKWGEAVKAIVVLKPGQSATPEEIIAFVRQRIAGYKAPKSVDFVDALPRNPSGKILKRELRRKWWPADGRAIN